jgi:hypothetical protein
MTHALRGGLLQVGPGQLVEVLLYERDLSALVVEIQKRPQVGEVVSLAKLPHGAVPETYPIASGHLEHHLRFQGTFDVNMQLRLG